MLACEIHREVPVHILHFYRLRKRRPDRLHHCQVLPDKRVVKRHFIIEVLRGNGSRVRLHQCRDHSERFAFLAREVESQLALVRVAGQGITRGFGEQVQQCLDDAKVCRRVRQECTVQRQHSGRSHPLTCCLGVRPQQHVDDLERRTRPACDVERQLHVVIPNAHRLHARLQNKSNNVRRHVLADNVEGHASTDGVREVRGKRALPQQRGEHPVGLVGIAGVMKRELAASSHVRSTRALLHQQFYDLRFAKHPLTRVVERQTPVLVRQVQVIGFRTNQSFHHLDARATQTCQIEGCLVVHVAAESSQRVVPNDLEDILEARSVHAEHVELERAVRVHLRHVDDERGRIPQLVSRQGVAVLVRPLKPHPSLVGVLHHPLSVAEAIPKPVLRVRVSLLRATHEPCDRNLLVLLHADTVVVAHSAVEDGFRVSGRSCLRETLERRLVISRLSERVPLFKLLLVHRKVLPIPIVFTLNVFQCCLDHLSLNAECVEIVAKCHGVAHRLALVVLVLKSRNRNPCHLPRHHFLPFFRNLPIRFGAATKRIFCLGYFQILKMSGILKVGDKVKYKSHSHGGGGDGIAVGLITGVEIRYFIDGNSSSVPPYAIVEKLSWLSSSSSSSSPASSSSKFSSTTS